MNITVLAFGILSDLLENDSIQLTLEKQMSVSDFKQYLIKNFSKLNGYSNFSIAINEAYASDDILLNENDVVALIPPVSGG
ncbi:MoaD/ThiS family protein [Aureivirga sp. CE67]|uniref:MoaD/ThiS family protein n=1 Tax=Aureivirga sp. CE67 TaxID=1788983 RepID=UPI0018C90FF4|nr:MoaD/ThiS family protein [Aureivirga sp. CE67]